MRRSRKPAPHPISPTATPREAEGVAYSENPAAPGLKFFACVPYSATLSMKGCASRWREAQAAPADQGGACRACSIGAAHAGETHVAYSSIFGAAICPRCRRGTTRMIKNRLCVSCQNRDYELAKGKNARGNRPVELQARQPHPVEFRLHVNGCGGRVRVGRVVDLGEAMIQAMRTTRGELAFGHSAPFLLRQGRLL